MLQIYLDKLVHQLWVLLIRIGTWLRPVQVHHVWTDTTAVIFLQPTQPVVPYNILEVLGLSCDSTAGAQPMHLFQISDSHVSLSPLSGAYENIQGRRMHNAFAGGSASIRNGSQVFPAAAFRELVDHAAANAIDLVALTGDVLNFPQAEGVLWATSMLNSSLRYFDGPWKGTRVPYIYTTGNHDWFFEGLPSEQWALQRVWRQSALHPFYSLAVSDGNPAGCEYDFCSYEKGGILFLTIDNSRYQVTRRQLYFFRSSMLRFLPTVLLLHVPLSISESLRPHRDFVLCGDPSWGEATDRSWQHESRNPWPKDGNSVATELFLEAVLASAAPKGPLMAVLAGHTHAHDATPFTSGPVCGAVDEEFHEKKLVNGAVQYIAEPAYKGGYRMLDIQVLHHSRSQDAGRKDVADIDAHMSARKLLLGMTLAALKATDQQTLDELAAWACWKGIKHFISVSSFLDLSLIAESFDIIQRRTLQALRHSFLLIAKALHPLLSHQNCQPVHQLLAVALPIWADPPSLAYRRGSQLQVQPNCSMSKAAGTALLDWLEYKSWTQLGSNLFKMMRASICK